MEGVQGHLGEMGEDRPFLLGTFLQLFYVFPACSIPQFCWVLHWAGGLHQNPLSAIHMMH